MNINTTLEKLYSLQKFGIKLGLQNIEALLNYLGNPQNNFKSFHIAGSNGKGSTSSFISSILQESGYKTGLYTSPHFISFNERIRVDGLEIPDSYISDFIIKIDELLNSFHPTFFEVTTAIAFSYFAEMQVDYAVIETGLGGRLDSTNIISPVASVITSISLEHTEILGSSIEEITYEKAGIIKNNIKVFTGKLPDISNEIIKTTCNRNHCDLFSVSEFVLETGNEVNFKTPQFKLYNISPALKGKFQKYNAALASLVVSKTLNITDAVVYQKAFNNVVKNTGIQGRYEVISTIPKIIFDSAHNSEGVNSFLETFSEEKHLYDKRILLFGAMKDKAVKEMLQMLSPHFDEFYFISIDMERCSSLDELHTIADELKLKSFSVYDVTFFINEFICRNNNHCLVALGSMYILGDIKSKLLKKKLDIIFN